MTAHNQTFSNRPAWVAFFTLPAILTAMLTAKGLYVVRLAELPLGFTGLSAVPDPQYAELGALGLGAFLAAILGPHLTLLGSLVMLALTWILSPYIDVYGYTHPLLTFFETTALVSGLGAIGVSAGGGAPGLRYGTMFAAWTGWLIAPLLARFLAMSGFPPTWIASSLAALAAVLTLLPTLTWWFSKKHPRPASSDSSFRVAGIVAISVVLIVAIYAIDTPRSMRLVTEPLILNGTASWAYLTHLLTASILGVGLSLMGLLLQIAKKPSRMGVLAGVGALVTSLAAVWAWSSASPSLILLGIASGFGQVLVLPWVWARGTSDTHWRLATAFAAVLLLAPHLVDLLSPLWLIAAMVALALTAIPLGALGWFGDEWVFGDVPGSDIDRRGRR